MYDDDDDQLAKNKCMHDHHRQTHSALLRWIVLALSCFFLMGNYYCYDNPAALKSQLQQHFSAYSIDAFEMRFVRGACVLLLLIYYACNVLCRCTHNMLCVYGYCCRTCSTRSTQCQTLCCRSSAARLSIALVLTQRSCSSRRSFSSGKSSLHLARRSRALEPCWCDRSLAAPSMLDRLGSDNDAVRAAQVGRFVVGLGGECLSVAQGALVVKWFKNEEMVRTAMSSVDSTLLASATHESRMSKS